MCAAFGVAIGLQGAGEEFGPALHQDVCINE